AGASNLSFYDLGGAALGAVLVTLLLSVFGGEAALLVGAIAPAVAGLLLATGVASHAFGPGVEDGPPATAGGSDTRGRYNYAPVAAPSRLIQIAAVSMVLVTAGCALAAIKFGAFRVKPGTTKAMRNQMDATPGSHIVQTGWNAYSRIDCVEGLPNSFARLYIDSDAWTGIRGWDGNLDSVQDMKWSYRALP